MTLAPFCWTENFGAFRGVRTQQYTYVRLPDRPWLLYDNLADPYQMNNLLDDPACAEVQATLDAELFSQLERNGDPFDDAETTVAKWGYTVMENKEINYNGHFVTQSPGPDKGTPCYMHPWWDK
jgi:hypothetical protein